jgi:multidrug efflux pump subunit AcrB
MHGIIAWFTRNGVAANLLMVGILIAGTVTLFTGIPTEVFPEFELDLVSVTVPYRGSTPAEVEESVVIRIEEAIQDLQGIKKILSTASEGMGSVRVEVDKGYDSREVLDDIKNRVDAINTFPVETEKPVISLVQPRGEVINVVLSAEMSEHDLRLLGERIRDEISNLPDITQVALGGVRPYEIAIEVSERTLQQYGLTLTAVANAIRRTSVDLPAGVIKSSAGEILLRTKGQAYVGQEFSDIVLITRPDGSRITLGDIATIKDGFEETPLYARFNGKPCVLIAVARVGDQNAITLARTVKQFLAERQRSLPAGVELNYWNDRSRIVLNRLNTLTTSAWQGGLLVLLVLTLFLRPAVAGWVFLGIPVAFTGAIIFMPALGVTINVISLFAFILVLGIVVDDAIVTGENIFTHLQKGEDSTEAAILGAQEVSTPVVFGVLTTVAAFTPLLMIEGFMGNIFGQIALIVIPVLIFSLVESKLILPAHLKHLSVGKRDREHLNPLLRFQRRFADGMEWFARHVYQPVLEVALRRRYLAFCTFVGIVGIIFAFVASNRIMFVFFPRVQSERATAALTMAQGTPTEVTARFVRRMEAAARELQNRSEYVDPGTGRNIIEDIMSVVGGQGVTGGRGRGASGQSHIGEVSLQLTAPEQRTLEVSSMDIVNEWRRMIGSIPGAQDLNFRAEIGRGSSPIDVQLSGPHFEELSAAADRVKERLVEYPDLFDITDTYQDGKPEIKLRIKPEAEALGLTMRDLAQQSREAFFGAEAQRIQRGREDIRVMVRYPLEQRSSLDSLENMRIRTANGAEVPFASVAEVEMGRGFSTISRIDRNRTVNVTADADKEKANLEIIKRDLVEFLPGLVAEYPGMNFSLEGEAREQADSFGAVAVGGIFVLFVIYAMLAIPFRSYIQPAIVMSVIPFGLAGAIVGHLIMGFNLSVMSVFGMLALAGVVVNDSLVLVDYINRRRREGMTTDEAVHVAGVARFRAIILTSLTTFCGLLPLMFEKSTQAQFLIPMGISLGWGVLLATGVTLLLVPINYLLLEDLKAALRRYWAWQTGREPRPGPGSTVPASNPQ